MDLDLKTYFMEHIQGLQELIRIPSVYDAATVSARMPYGKGVAAALEYMRQMACIDGFEVLEYDGHAIAIQTKPQKEGRIDVVSHLDVVEPGSGWSVDPFGGQIRRSRLYGRGTQDMKTSAYLTYLVLKHLKEENFPACDRLRIVFGCDEERTMEDMAYYVSKAGLPDFAFTPDGCFPMAIGEKGALMWRLSGRYKGPVRSMECGVQCNVVPPVAKAVLCSDIAGEKKQLRKASLYRSASEEEESCAPELMDRLKSRMQELGIDGKIEEKDGEILIEIKGKAAHASKPEDGHSAAVDLFCLLREEDSLMDNLYCCFADAYGRQWKPSGEGQDSDFTVNLGVFRIQNGECYGEVDARYPFGMNAEELTGCLAGKCALKVSLDYDSRPTMNEKDDPYVAKMLQVYREKTGDLSEPVISGGVSYSKIFGHCVAFGPVRSDMKNLCHQADENIALSDCEKAFEIYYETMKQLALLEGHRAKTPDRKESRKVSSAARQKEKKAKPCIVWQTDFGMKWGAVASMKGVCKQVDPALECVDITHDIEQYNILAASRELIYVEPFWPKGTVFVSVVDPGVGTDRKASVALLQDGNYVVTPDNGTLTHVFYEVGVREIREIDETINRYPGTENIAVFHGRDLFAYTAARLAAGVISFEEVGPAYSTDNIVLFEQGLLKAKTAPGKAEGFVISVSDPFGSIAFNVLSEDFKKAGFAHGDRVHVTLACRGEIYFDEEVLYAKSFGFVPVGEPILFDSSTNYVELGLNQGNFKEKYHVREGQDYSFLLEKENRG